MLLAILFWRMAALEEKYERLVVARLRQGRHQFDRRIPDTHLDLRVSCLQKLQRNLDRPVVADNRHLCRISDQKDFPDSVTKPISCLF